MQTDRRTNLDRDALIEEHLKKIRERLQEKLTQEVLDEATLDEIEETVGQIGREVTQDLQKRLLKRRSKQARDNQIECACGGRARYKGQQKRSVLTAHGSLSWQRPYYPCPRCQHSFAPMDRRLGLQGTSTTKVRVWATLLGGQLPFAQAATTLQMLTGVALSAASIEQVSVQAGVSLSSERHKQALLHQSGGMSDRRTPCPRRLYVGMDGLFVPLREAWKKDGSGGDLTCRSGECKIGVVYETEQDKDGKDARVSRHAYCATLEGVESFGPLISTLAHRQGHHAAKEVVVLGDGAAWIWQIGALRFAGAVQIVDFFHACVHLAEVADARFGKDTLQSRDWQKARQAELKTDQLSSVLKEIHAWRPTNEAKRELRRKSYAYFANNAHRMRYQTFLQQGYQIGSGVVEAAGKYVIGQRVDQAGMHWREETAEAMVTLRAALCSSVQPDLRPHCQLAA